jgi:tetraacyldisaccharide 4'-kinase
MHYPDHHIFTIDDLKEINKRFENIEAPDKIILSTEKDSVRLMKFNSDITDLPFYIIPAKHKFLFEEGEHFNGIVTNFIQNFKPEVQN